LRPYQTVPERTIHDRVGIESIVNFIVLSVKWGRTTIIIIIQSAIVVFGITMYVRWKNWFIGYLIFFNFHSRIIKFMFIEIIKYHYGKAKLVITIKPSASPNKIEFSKNLIYLNLIYLRRLSFN
jgi:hypothetical protein